MLGFQDPVADAIGLLRPRTTIGPSVLAAGVWAARFDGAKDVKIGMIVRGSCWLILEGRDPVLLEQGDFYLLGKPPPYVIASTPDADPRAATPVGEVAVDGLARIGPDLEDHTYVCDGHFVLEDLNASVLTDVLPELVHVRAADQRGQQLARVSELLVAELEAAAVGSALVLNHLGQILLVHMLRAHAAQGGGPRGWLCALGDDGVGAALRAMHADVQHGWTLAELAGLGHMSRSAFAQAFKSQVGVAPLEYLIRWRMSLARDALRRDATAISELAAMTGYGSESAFSSAFRRVVGTSPSHFRDEHRRSVGGRRPVREVAPV